MYFSISKVLLQHQSANLIFPFKLHRSFKNYVYDFHISLFLDSLFSSANIYDFQW